MERSLHSIKGFLFDLDGCIYMGETPVFQAIETLECLYRRRIPFGFISNNSSSHPDEIRKKLCDMGLSLDCKNTMNFPVILAGDCAGKFILARYGKSRVFVVGNEALNRAVIREGHESVSLSEEDCSLVLVGRDTQFSWERFERAVNYIQKGAGLCICNPDASHPGPDGLLIPETGALSAAILQVVPVTYTCVGKPEPFLFQTALRMLSLGPDQTAIVGDNLSTDIIGGRNAGLYTVHVSSGPESLQTNRHVSGQVIPDLHIETMEELKELIVKNIPGGTHE